jgi:ribA/ribD-fused uncharacterized protein
MIENLESLQNEIRRGNKELSYLFFWRNKSCLSQWYPSSFNIRDTNFKTAEHYMMYEKAKLFGDVMQAVKILKVPDPRTAKALGRKVKGFKERIWKSKYFDIVVDGNLAKFSQNYRARKFLMNTGNRILVEASPYDKIWGIGLDSSHKDAQNPLRWQGTNLLGFALTKVRSML